MKKLKVFSHDGVAPTATFIGGMRFGSFNATVPLVRLELFSDKLRMKASTRAFKRFIPMLEAEYVNITEVQVVSNSIGEGIRILSKEGERSAIFWTFKPEPALSAMRALGLNVLDKEGQFHFRDPEH